MSYLLALLAGGSLLQATALALAWWSSVETPLVHERVVALAAAAGLLLHLVGGGLWLGLVRRAHLSLALAALPPVLLLVVIGLGGRDLLGRRPGAAVALLGPLVLIALAGWRRAAEARAPRRTPGELAVSGAFLVMLAASLTVTLLPWVAWYDARTVSSQVGSSLQWEATGDNARIVALAREYRLPSDPSISLAEASRAYHAIATRTARGLEFPWLRPPVSRRDWLPKPNPINETFAGLARRATTGLAPAEREYLQRLAADPAFRDVTLVARAPALDAPAALFVLPVPDTVPPSQITLGFTNHFMWPVQALTLRAALELDRRQVGAAETTLREVISLALAVYDNAISDSEITLAVSAMRAQGLDNLALLYELSGRAEDGRRLRAPLPPAPAAGDPKDLIRGLTAMSDLVNPRPHLQSASALSTTRTRLRQVVGGSEWPRGHRTAKLNELVETQCANVGEMVFGPEPGLLETVRAYAASVVSRPGEQEVYRVAWEGNHRLARFHRAKEDRDTLTTLVDVWLRSIAGNDRVVGCAQGAIATFAFTLAF